MDELAKKFAELATQYGPGVVEAARAATRVQAYSNLASAAVFSAAGAALVYFGGRVFAREYAKAKVDYDGDFTVVAAGFTVFVGAVFLAANVFTFVDPWTWTAITNPDIFLAKHVMKL